MQDNRRTLSISPRAGAAYDPATAVIYGQLIETAYAMYDAQPNNPTPPPPATLPGGYRFIAWVQMQDFIIENTGPQFYGLIAQGVSNPNQFVLAIRGTSGWVEWWDDLNAIRLVPFKDAGSGMVGAGFARIYNTLEVVTPPTAALAEAAPRSLRAAGGFSKQVSALLARHTAAGAAEGFAPSASIVVTGHSLGAALATLYVLDNALTDRIKNPSIYTFASPRVGDATFAGAFDSLGLASWRIANVLDIVPRVPLGFTHVDALQQYDSFSTALPTPACCHALTTYLALIDSSLKPDSGCQWPFKAPAPMASVAEPAHPRAVAPAASQPAAPAPFTQAIPAGPVNLTITINVDARE
ncbi:MAG TPA: lipase family protein [Methylocystis sp.]